MREAREQIGDELRREGDEAPDDELGRRCGVVHGAGQRDGEADEAGAEGDGRGSVVLLDDERIFVMRGEPRVDDAIGRAISEAAEEIGGEGDEAISEIGEQVGSLSSRRPKA